MSNPTRPAPPKTYLSDSRSTGQGSRLRLPDVDALRGTKPTRPGQ
jgi:hypothetical protein